MIINQKFYINGIEQKDFLAHVDSNDIPEGKTKEQAIADWIKAIKGARP